MQLSDTSRGIPEPGDTQGGAGIVNTDVSEGLMEHSTDDYWHPVKYSHWPDSD